MTFLLLSAVGVALAGTPLSYEDALQQALERNPTLLSTEAGIAQAEGALLAAQGIFDPSLGAGINYSSDVSQNSFFSGVDQRFQLAGANVGVTGLLPTGTTLGVDFANRRQNTAYDGNPERIEQLRQGGILNEEYQYRSVLSASVTQSILQGFRMAYNLSSVRQARRARDQAEAELLRQRNETLASVAGAYWDLWYQRRAVAIAEKSLEVAREESRIVAAKIAQGTLAGVEQARVAAAVVQAESALVTARATAQAANDLLLTLLGERPGVSVDLTTGPAAINEAGVEVERAVEAALQNNPELQSLRLARDNAELDVQDARHQLLPELTASGSYGLTGLENRDPNSPAALGTMPAAPNIFTGEARNWSVGLNASVPLGNKVDRGNRDQKVAALEVAKRNLEAREYLLAQQVRAAAANIETTRAQVKLMRANLELAEQTLAAERALADAGRSLQRDVLEAIKNVDDARLNLENAKANYLLAIIELERLKGSL